jgi:hypothetical protein
MRLEIQLNHEEHEEHEEHQVQIMVCSSLAVYLVAGLGMIKKSFFLRGLRALRGFELSFPA